MRFRRPLAAFSLLLAGLAAAACSTAPTETEGDDEGALEGDAEVLDVGDLARALFAAPGSAARKSAGASLRHVVDVASKQIGRASDEAAAADQDFTKTLIGYTAEYLASGEACDARQKIRVFRGIGSGVQPVLRATTDERVRALHVEKPMMDAMRRLGVAMPPQGATGMAALNGVELYKALVTEQKPLAMRIDSDRAAAKALSERIAKTSDETNVFSASDETSKRAIAELKKTVQETDYGFSYQFGLERTFNDFDADEDRPVDLMWSAIATDHTQGAPWGGGAGSPFSPLVSTSVDAIEKWGPIFIVADVCPERAVFATSRVDSSEQEVYVPLFILPEEIVTITTTPEELYAVAAPAANERPLDAAYRACLGQTTSTPYAGMDAYRAAIAKKLPLPAFRSELERGVVRACSAPTECPAGCVVSNYCKDNVTSDPLKSALALWIDGRPCVASGAPGCKVDGCH